jgi:hypothetical protein
MVSTSDFLDTLVQWQVALSEPPDDPTPGHTQSMVLSSTATRTFLREDSSQVQSVECYLIDRD